MTEVLMCSNVSRRYESAGASVNSLWDVSFRAGAGEMVAIVGPSGSGKTTLLCVAAGLERPDSGEVEITGRRLSSMNEIELDSLRSRCIGFAFQEPGLVPLLTALENVELGAELAAVERTDIRDRAKQALEIVGLSSRALHRAHELSGGEQHRVAIARALAKQPRLLLADEPTAQLDSESAAALVGLLSDVAKWGAAVVVSTHDASLVAGADRVLQLEDGRVVASSEQRGSRPRLLR